MFWIWVLKCVFVRLFNVFVYFVFFWILCAFVVGCVSSTLNDGIVRFKCGQGGSHIFTHSFVKAFHFFNFCIVFVSFRGFRAF